MLAQVLNPMRQQPKAKQYPVRVIVRHHGATFTCTYVAHNRKEYEHYRGVFFKDSGTPLGWEPQAAMPKGVVTLDQLDTLLTKLGKPGTTEAMVKRDLLEQLIRLATED